MSRTKAFPAFEPPGGMPLGLFETAQFGEQTFTLEPGDSFLLYTDGVTEARDASDDLYEDERLIRTLSASAGETAESDDRTGHHER